MYNALPKLSRAIFVAAILAKTSIFVHSQHLNQFVREAMQRISVDSLYQHIKFLGTIKLIYLLEMPVCIIDDKLSILSAQQI